MAFSTVFDGFYYKMCSTLSVVRSLRAKLLSTKNGGRPLTHMGLNQKQKGTYISILSGKFSQRVDEGTPDAVLRTNKLGAQVWEKFYDSLTGKLTGITIKDGDYGKSWNFHFVDDEGEVFHLQLSFSNSYATAFLKMLPNVDLTQPMTLSPSQKIKDGKTQSSLFINQNNVPIKHAFTKDNPNGMPDMEQKKVKGKVVWDDSDRLDFLVEMVNRDILPKLNQAPIDAKAEPKEKEKSLDEMMKDSDVEEEAPF